MVKKVLIVIIVLVVTGTILWMGNMNKKRMSEKINIVSTEPISITNDLDVSISTKGKIKAKDNKIYHAIIPFNAIVKNVNVEDKQHIEKDQVLISVKRYSDEEYKNRLDTMNIQLKDKQHQLNSIVKNNNQDIYNYKKLENEINMLQNEISKLNEEQNYDVKASLTGSVIFSKELYAGCLVNSNESIMKVIDLSNIDSMYIETELSDSEYNNIRKDSSAKIILTVGGVSKTLMGAISSNTPKLIEKNDVDYYTVKIDLNKSDEKLDLKLDMPVDVNIKSKIEVKNNAASKGEHYILPVYAIIMRNNKNVVFVYSKKEGTNDHFAKLVNVDILASNDNKVIVKSSNLDKDSIIITEGNYNLQGGEKVIVGKGDNNGSLDLNLFN